MYKNIPDREKTYFHHGIVGIRNAVNWLAKHEKVIPYCIGYHGSSQGGAFGFILGGSNIHIAAIVSNVPAMCDHLGYKQGRLAGWPQFCRQMNNSPEIEEMAQYYDAMNFARFIRVPVRVIVGLADRTCSPSSVYAAYNQIPSRDKQIISEVGMGHEVWPSYSKEIAWMKNYLLKRKDTIQCMNSLKRMTLAFAMFASDHNDAFPTEANWQKELYDYIGETTFNCPESGKPYHYVRQSITWKKIKNPSRVILFYDEFGSHGNRICIAFTDGHVQEFITDGCKTIEELAERNQMLLKAEEK